MDERKCSDCKWWRRARPYRWGMCECPTPAWLADTDSPPIVPGLTMTQAERCNCFKED